MERYPHDPLTRWLEAEDASRPDEAEAALAALFTALPDLGPRPGFAGRVMQRVRRSEPAVARWRDPFASLWLRLAVAFALFATGLAFPWVRTAVAPLLPEPSLSTAVRAGAGLALEVVRSLTAALDLGGNLLAFVRALAAPFDNPPVAGGMALLLAVAAVSFRWLYDLITRERSWSYADPL